MLLMLTMVGSSHFLSKISVEALHELGRAIDGPFLLKHERADSTPKHYIIRVHTQNNVISIGVNDTHDDLLDIGLRFIRLVWAEMIEECFQDGIKSDVKDLPGQLLNNDLIIDGSLSSKIAGCAKINWAIVRSLLKDFSPKIADGQGAEVGQPWKVTRDRIAPAPFAKSTLDCGSSR